MMLLMVAVLLTVCTVGSDGGPLNVCVQGQLQCAQSVLVCTCMWVFHYDT